MSDAFAEDYWSYVDDSLAYGFEEFFTDLQILDMFTKSEEFTRKTGENTYVIVKYPKRKMTQKEKNMYKFLNTQLWFKCWLADCQEHGWFIGDGQTVEIPSLSSDDEWSIIRKTSNGNIPKPPVISYFKDYDPHRKYEKC
jgi:hypothetical protein